MHESTTRWKLVGWQPRGDLRKTIDLSWQLVDGQSLGHECAARRGGDWHPRAATSPDPKAGSVCKLCRIGSSAAKISEKRGSRADEPRSPV
eukprot:scaffold69255_cov66-Phaeocystis_antarctica.AAC.1